MTPHDLMHFGVEKPPEITFRQIHTEKLAEFQALRGRR